MNFNSVLLAYCTFWWLTVPLFLKCYLTILFTGQAIELI